MVGLDIQPCGLRWVQLSHRRQGYVLERAILIEPVEQFFVEGKIKHWGRLSAQLAASVEQYGAKRMAAALCLPSNMVRLQRILLPKGMAEEEKEAEILSQLQRGLPGVSDTLRIDFVSVGMTRADQDEVLVVAAREEYVARFVDCVNAAGLEVKVVDVDICALQRVSAFMSDISLNIHLTASSATLIILKQNDGLHYRQWVVSTMPELVSEIHRYMSACHADDNQNIAVYGADEVIPLFHQAWVRTSKIVPIYPDIFLQLKQAENAELNFMESNPADFLVACGLAMRKVPAW